jgi:hypothetical protein
MRTVVHGDRLAVIGGDGAIYAMEAVTWQVEPTTVKGVPNHRVFASSFNGLRLFRGPDRRTLLSEGPLSWRPGFDLVDREQRSWGARQIARGANVRGVVVALGNFVGLDADNSR